ncbi:MAG: hypothetical protein CMJ76_08565 [Planctomycetaceae bacterium]|nr:hypothetical protein [Planctomycetaceae bacterium]
MGTHRSAFVFIMRGKRNVLLIRCSGLPQPKAQHTVISPAEQLIYVKPSFQVNHDIPSSKKDQLSVNLHKKPGTQFFMIAIC